MPEQAQQPLTQSNGQKPPSERPRSAPKTLPKGPQSQEVAQRIIKHSTLRPVKRFDSADYFLEQYEVRKQWDEEHATSQEGARDAPSCEPELEHPPALAMLPEVPCKH